MSLMPSCCKKRPQRNATGAFTAEEIAIVRSTWQAATKREEEGSNIGMKIITSLIAQKPKYGSYFGVPANTPTKNISQFTKVIDQADRIQRFIGSVVNGLKPNDNDTVLQLAKHVGMIHFYRGVNFEAETWILFKTTVITEVTAINEQPLESEISRIANLTPRLILPKHLSVRLLSDAEATKKPSLLCDVTIAQAVWSKLMSVIVREMKRGFLEETLRHCECKEEEPNRKSTPSQRKAAESQKDEESQQKWSSFRRKNRQHTSDNSNHKRTVRKISFFFSHRDPPSKSATTDSFPTRTRTAEVDNKNTNNNTVPKPLITKQHSSPTTVDPFPIAPNKHEEEGDGSQQENDLPMLYVSFEEQTTIV